jgi:hypothetical protein
MIVISGVLAVFSWNAGNRALTPINGILFINLVLVTTFVISILSGYNMRKLEVVGAVVTIAALVSNNLYQQKILLSKSAVPRAVPAAAAWRNRSRTEIQEKSCTSHARGVELFEEGRSSSRVEIARMEIAGTGRHNEAPGKRHCQRFVPRLTSPRWLRSAITSQGIAGPTCSAQHACRRTLRDRAPSDLRGIGEHTRERILEHVENRFPVDTTRGSVRPVHSWRYTSRAVNGLFPRPVHRVEPAAQLVPKQEHDFSGARRLRACEGSRRS